MHGFELGGMRTHVDLNGERNYCNFYTVNGSCRGGSVVINVKISKGDIVPVPMYACVRV